MIYARGVKDLLCNPRYSPSSNPMCLATAARELTGSHVSLTWRTGSHRWLSSPGSALSLGRHTIGPRRIWRTLRSCARRRRKNGRSAINSTSLTVRAIAYLLCGSRCCLIEACWLAAVAYESVLIGLFTIFRGKFCPLGGTAHSSKERRRPLFWQPFWTVAEPAPGLLAPLSGFLTSRRRKQRKNGEKRVQNGRDTAI